MRPYFTPAAEPEPSLSLAKRTARMISRLLTRGPTSTHKLRRGAYRHLRVNKLVLKTQAGKMRSVWALHQNRGMRLHEGRAIETETSNYVLTQKMRPLVVDAPCC